MIYLDFEGREIAVSLKNESRVHSRHTGTELRHIEVSLAVNNQQEHEKITDIIRSARENGIQSTDGQGRVLDKWIVKNNSYSYTGGSTDSRYFHSIELEEMENLNVDSLVLGKLELQPYSYEEKFNGDALIIQAKVLLSKIQYANLKELMLGELYFPVIRHGLSEEPCEMRFGQTLWSKHKDGIKHELHLIDRIYDETNPRFRGLFNPEMSNMQKIIAGNTEIIEELIARMAHKGLLEVKELDDIRAKASERIWDREREFYRLEDIDKS